MKKKGFIINMAGVGVAVAALVTVNILALSTYRLVISTYLGGSGLTAKKDSTTDVWTSAKNTVDDIMDEGMVLLKNDNKCLPLGSDDTTFEVKANVFFNINNASKLSHKAS